MTHPPPIEALALRPRMLRRQYRSFVSECIFVQRPTHYHQFIIHHHYSSCCSEAKAATKLSRS